MGIDFADEARGLQGKLVEWRRELHSMPETGLSLSSTARFVRERLEELGIEYEEYSGFSGLRASVRGYVPGRAIALRADMDGLPIVEETGLAFSSTNGNMHACGHDAHAAMLLGAASLLARHRDAFAGEARFLFQPDEEGARGAAAMIQAGALDNPRVDAAIGLHIGSVFPGFSSGEIGYRAGKMMASYDRFVLRVVGKSCHGAMPEAGRDPIVAAAGIVSALQTIVSRTLRPTHPAVVSIGRVAGGTAYNVIPESVELEGTCRALDESDRDAILMRIEKISSGMAEAMGLRCECRITRGGPCLENDSAFTEGMLPSLRQALGSDRVRAIEEPSMVGEDMSLYLREVPGCFLFLGGALGGHPHHSSRFDIDESALWAGTAVLAQCAADFLALPPRAPSP
jgi:amidohydrolase